MIEGFLYNRSQDSIIARKTKVTENRVTWFV